MESGEEGKKMEGEKFWLLWGREEGILPRFSFLMKKKFLKNLMDD